MSRAALERATKSINATLAELRFDDPVACVYNPLEYARRSHTKYVRQFGQGPKRAILLGMNPGPFGMAQTGVPFGEIAAVRDWLGISAPVDKPPIEHPKRPIDGFACTRSEVSGRRLWGFVRDRFGTPAEFFRDYFVHNYCPLAFMEESGRNLTPDKLPAEVRRPLFEACDRYLIDVVNALQPELIVGVGAFAENRARKTLASMPELRFARLPHPSPASPAANRGWDELAARAFDEFEP